MNESEDRDESWIDPIADRFERAWKDGGQPRIEAFLNEAQGDAARRVKLLEELLRVERSIRVKRGDTPSSEEYRRRFPEHAAIVETAFSETLMNPGPVPTNDWHPITEGPGTRIGPYKLLQLIGEGGMGAVYMAEQETPVRRRVALKIIKPGMDTLQVVARFEAERQALALMDHQHIAKVFDAGATETGRPYFVMELVKGVSITEYCDRNQLTPRERLELFVPVCQAVQHAHQKGIIHRDLKPSNVLVTLYDGKPVPKIIDFGIAKATNQRLTERTVFTDLGMIIGTLEYMSPEQAELNALDVDTRTDVYSLGVMLYELLTGTTPLERARLKKAALDEVLKRIRDEEPPKPSTRLSDSVEALPSISAQRKVEPAQLTKLVRGELDWIVMKALEKDRIRRYETANSFARDIERYLHDEPVEACPPSAGYRMRKFARKHRFALTTAAAFALLLVLGAALSTWQAVRATKARDAARVSEAHAKEQEARALASEAHAKEQEARALANEAKARDEEARARQAAAEAQAVLNFFQDRVLAAARPEGQNGGLGRDATIRRALDVAEPLIGPAFRDQPLIEASIRHVLGMTYHYLGESVLAIRQTRRALEIRTARLGPEHADTLTSQSNLANLYQNAGQLELALPLYESTLAARKAAFGPNHPDTLTSQNRLASAYQSAGKLDLALPLYESTLAARKAALGPEHPDTLATQNGLASAYQSAGKFDLALPLLERTLAARKSVLGPEHPDTLTSQNNLASAYIRAGKLDLALPLFEQTLETTKAKLGPDHPDTLAGQNNLAGAYIRAGKLDLALPLFERTLEATRAKLGPDHPDTLASQNNLAYVYQRADKLDLALPLFERTLSAMKAKLGPEHPETLASQNNLAFAYQSAGKLDLAVPLFERTLAAMKTALGPDHPDTLDTQNNLALALHAQGDHGRETAVWRDGLAIREQAKPGHWTTFEAQNLLGDSLLDEQKYAEAEPPLVAGYEGMKAREVDIPEKSKKRLLAAGKRVVALYEAWEKPEKAAEWRAKLGLKPPPAAAGEAPKP